MHRDSRDGLEQLRRALGSADLAVRLGAARDLGRTVDPAALPDLLRCLADPAMRPHAVEALADLGDARAVPALERLLDDTTDAWPEDIHGPMLRVCDLAAGAVRRLRAGVTPGGPSNLAAAAARRQGAP